MRLLVVTHNYPRFEGDPAGWYVWRLAQVARDAGLEVLVLAPHAAGVRLDGAEDRLAVRRFRYGPAWLERIGYRGERLRRILGDPLSAVALPLYAAGFVLAARRAARDFRPDLIHAHWWLPSGWAVSGLRVPFVVTCHGTDVRLLESGPFRRLARPVLARAGAVTTVSRFLADDIGRRAGPLPRPVQVVPMPLDVEAFARGNATPKAVPPRVLYAGNLVPAKGVDVLIRAVALVAERGTACRLRILGEGPDRGRLKNLARDLGIADRIDWSDFVPRDVMPAEYGASTVTVLPSRGEAEGLGLALAEALCAGSAVVATPAGGIPEIVTHEETGLLARDGDAPDLAAQLERLLRDRSLRDRLTQAGAAHVRQRFSPAATAKTFLELYHSVAHDHRPR
jgi:glycosyltransferase involved in cell wall biosynthesis